MNDYFRSLAHNVSIAVGSYWAFAVALLLILAWIVSGPIFGYSDTWQLVINTATTIVTFLMVFLIQNTQNRDAQVFHLKLNELIRAIENARDGFVDLEEFSDDALKQIQEEFRVLHEKYGEALSPVHRLLHEHADREAGRRAQRP